MEQVKFFIDCDPGIDDMMALTYAVAHPHVEIVGAVASGGNVSTEQVGRNLRGMLQLLDADEIPWELGAENPLNQRLTTTEETHGSLGTGYAQLPRQNEPTHKELGKGATLWVEMANTYPGQLHGVVLGPCTNLALALQHDPTLVTKLASLHIMGGALNHRGNTMPTTEWNIHSDPEAAHAVFDAFSTDKVNCHPVLCALDFTEEHIVTPEIRAELCAGESPVTKALDDALQFYMEFHEWDGLGFIAHVHDPFVTAYAINEALDATGISETVHLADTVETVIDVELDGKLTRGQTIADWLGRWERRPNAAALSAVFPQKFFTHYIQTVRTKFAR